MNNPLLQTVGLPNFAAITVADIEPAIDQLLKQNRLRIGKLLADHPLGWEKTLQEIEDMKDILNRVWSPVSHLHAVADTPELREVYRACLLKLSDYATEMGQNKDLYLAYRQVSKSALFISFDGARKTLIDNALREFKLSGIELDESAQSEYKKIKQSLSKLATKFEENLLDATHSWKKHFSSSDGLKGLPPSILELMAEKATAAGKSGWLLNLGTASYMMVMKYADDAALREQIYMAYVTRASDQAADAQWDNTGIMCEIVALRRRQALLLGYESYAHYSLSRKAADSTGEVLDFLYDLVAKCKNTAQQEWQAIQEFARSEYGVRQLQVWDINYYSEKLRQHEYSFSTDQLRSYFPVEQVIAGMFTLVNRLYGIDIKERKSVEVWHKEVKFFDIFDHAGGLRGGFYLDIYSRAGKREGAWMDECICRKRHQSVVQIPVAYLCCNFAPPAATTPSLLTHDEVITLFHEFGHGLHHLLTLVDYPAVSGINGVPWDLVELPSQFMENWCWQREALDLIARHYETGDLISETTLQEMTKSRNFQSGMQMLRQIEYALFDFRLYLENDINTPADIQSLLDDIRRQIAVVIPPAYNRFQNSFSHIFSGGYAAGYYSYKWAEVLSADAFSRFEEEGILNRDTGGDFLHSILESGGVGRMMDNFIHFRGRPPRIDALLKHSGIVN